MLVFSPQSPVLLTRENTKDSEKSFTENTQTPTSENPDVGHPGALRNCRSFRLVDQMQAQWDGMALVDSYVDSGLSDEGMRLIIQGGGFLAFEGGAGGVSLLGEGVGEGAVGVGVVGIGGYGLL